LDLDQFLKYLEHHFQKPLARIHVEDLQLKDLERYEGHLKLQGDRTNSRRRKLISLKRFLGYYSKRANDRPPSVAEKWRTLPKVERVPQVLSLRKVFSALEALKLETNLNSSREFRDLALLRTLAETGAALHEVVALRSDQVAAGEILFQDGRRVPISKQLESELRILADGGGLFRGHQGSQKLPGGMTTRAAELVIRSLATKWEVQGVWTAADAKLLTARNLRHSCVLWWKQQGLTDLVIQERLGLRSNYAFRAYRKLFEWAEREGFQVVSS
jgi:integrase